MSWMKLRIEHTLFCPGGWIAMRDGSQACALCGVWRKWIGPLWLIKRRNKIT